MRLEEELEILQERIQEEYLNRIRDDNENKKKYKNLINDRRKYIEEVFEEHDNQDNKLKKSQFFL